MGCFANLSGTLEFKFCFLWLQFWTQFFLPFPKFGLLVNAVFGIWRHVVRPKFIDASEDRVASIIRVDGRLHSPDDNIIIVTTVITCIFLIVELTVGLFYIHGSVHRESNLITVQQDANVFSLL